MYRHCTILTVRGLSLLLGLLVAGTCQAGEPSMSSAAGISGKPKESRMWMTINEHRFAITLADNKTARAFATQLPLTLHMEELNGNEKHAKLPTSLPTNTNASRPGTIRNGDLMLYGEDTLVVFYSTFNSMYSYTRLGRVDDTASLAQALGPGSAQIIFSGQ